MTAPSPSARWYTTLYLQVLIAVVAGILLGVLAPAAAIALKPLGDGFIKLVKMIIAPVIFCSVVGGIGGIGGARRLGRVGLKALGYFLVVSTLALALGLLVANVFHPGAGLDVDPAQLDTGAISGFQGQAHRRTVTEFLLQIIPDTALGAFTSGEILQVLLFSLLFGLGLMLAGERARPAAQLIDAVGVVIFRVVALIMRLAPLGAFGAMAYTVGKFGVHTLAHLGALMACFYLTSLLFVLGVLGAIARYNGFSLLRLLRYLRAELLLVLGTASSEAALPPLIDKLERAGCARAVAGLVVPAGYSFNLDGTNIYMTMAALFIAQATNVSLTLGDQCLLLLVAAVSSKGAAGVSGSGFITLAATLAVVPTVPVAGMVLIIGNAVATLVIARWEGELDAARLERVLAGDSTAVHT